MALPIPCGKKQQYGVHLISCGSLSVYFGVYSFPVESSVISYGLNRLLPNSGFFAISRVVYGVSFAFYLTPYGLNVVNQTRLL